MFRSYSYVGVRLLKDRMEPIRPTKRRKLAHGVESKDMSRVTLENVHKRSVSI
jgi:hypothetical protein